MTASGRTGNVSRRGVLAAALAAAPLAGAKVADAAPHDGWALAADVVVVGSGATGVPAAIAAREAGASVILIEAEDHLGGHAICSGGNVALAGTAFQRRYGVEDSPDLLFRDLTDWSVIEPNGAADYRYNDREIVRAFADINPYAYDWLIGHGVVFADRRPDTIAGDSIGNSVPREHHAVPMDWPLVQTGQKATAEQRTTLFTGNGLMAPLIAAANKAGVNILTGHRMTALAREAPRRGRVSGVVASNNGRTLRMRARKAVILGTGGSTGNVNFRRMFDPRLTDEYCGLAGMPYSNQDASGELAAMDVGAALWGLANQSGEFGPVIEKAGLIGARYGYSNLRWRPGSPVFDKVGGAGLPVADWQDVILVNMLGRRFYDETGRAFTANKSGDVAPYTQGSYRNVDSVKFKPNNFINAALAGFGDGHNGGGPIWAIFDADAVVREKWTPSPPEVDIKGGFFFQADTLEDLARKIVMPHQRLPMPPAELAATVERYNGFVASGRDEDFGKPAPRYAIRKAPFYAAWATPIVHDARSGVRINAHCQVVDMHGETIPGLYCGGESAGGFSTHGLARAICQGLIAARHATA